MTTFTSIIGWIFLVCAIIGAIVPGWNMHVAFGTDDTVQKWHQRNAESMKKELEDARKD